MSFLPLHSFTIQFNLYCLLYFVNYCGELVKFVLVILLFFNFNQLLSNNKVYILNYSWHSGFLIKIEQKAIDKIPALKLFSEYKYVDIGWGDSDFYRSNIAFDPILAFKAAFLPTKSTLRIEGINNSIKQLLHTYNFLIMYEYDDDNYNKLLEFINSSITYYDEKAKIIEKRQALGIVYFQSPLTYHILNTCNTWIARGLSKAGCPSRAFGVIHSTYLYKRFSSCGKIIKLLK